MRGMQRRLAGGGMSEFVSNAKDASRSYVVDLAVLSGGSSGGSLAGALAGTAVNLSFDLIGFGKGAAATTADTAAMSKWSSRVSLRQSSVPLV